MAYDMVFIASYQFDGEGRHRVSAMHKLITNTTLPKCMHAHIILYMHGIYTIELLGNRTTLSTFSRKGPDYHLTPHFVDTNSFANFCTVDTTLSDTCTLEG